MSQKHSGGQITWCREKGAQGEHDGKNDAQVLLKDHVKCQMKESLDIFLHSPFILCRHDVFESVNKGRDLYVHRVNENKHYSVHIVNYFLISILLLPHCMSAKWFGRNQFQVQECVLLRLSQLSELYFPRELLFQEFRCIQIIF